LDELLAKQHAILDRAAALVRPGGRLVYATCSVLPDENVAQVAGFLSRRDDFESLDLCDPATLDAPVAAAALGDGPFLRLSPARHATDGFFCAVLRRRD
ncbi:MAG: rRNA cytosine-C5-methylase, partial [Jatrophihabitans endophyticus]